MAFVVNCCGIAGGVLALGQSAQANDLYTARGWRAAEPCAAITPDFPAVGATDTCMRYGGRVRVEFGAHAPGAPDRASGVAPAVMRTNNAARSGEIYQATPHASEGATSRGHLRLPDDVAGAIAR